MYLLFVLEHLNIKLNTDDSYEYSVEGFWLDRFRADVFGRINIEDMSETERNISADAMIEYLAGEKRFCIYSENGEPYTEEEKRKYGIPDEWNKEDILKLLGIRYELSIRSYQRYLPVTIAEDISPKVMAVISENKRDLLESI